MDETRVSFVGALQSCELGLEAAQEAHIDHHEDPTIGANPVVADRESNPHVRQGLTDHEPRQQAEQTKAKGETFHYFPTSEFLSSISIH